MDLILGIHGALAPLVGLPLWDAGRAANMLWLQFGAELSAPTNRSPTRTTGEYALHVQCPWRVTGPVGVLAGSSDIYVPADPDIDEADFIWDKPGDALGDERLKRWITAYEATPLVVQAVVVDRCGGFVLQLPYDFAFEVFPDATCAPHDIRDSGGSCGPARTAPISSS